MAGELVVGDPDLLEGGGRPIPSCGVLYKSVGLTLPL